MLGVELERDDSAADGAATREGAFGLKLELVEAQVKAHRSWSEVDIEDSCLKRSLACDAHGLWPEQEDGGSVEVGGQGQCKGTRPEDPAIVYDSVQPIAEADEGGDGR